MSDGFRWNNWNLAHIAQHNVDPMDAEFVVLNAPRPYPSYEGDGRWLVRGQDQNGRYIQVVYIVDPLELGTFYIIHSRPLSEREKRNFRRRRK